MRWLGRYRPAVILTAPNFCALLVAGAGIMLIASGATPSDPERFAWLVRNVPVLLVEVSGFVSSLLGVVLVMIAFGLSRRLGTAWAASMALLPLTAVLALTKGFNWEESVVLVMVTAALAPLRPAFPRSARLSRMEVTPGWLISALAAVAGAAIAGWWSFQNLDQASGTVLAALGDPDRAIRNWAGAAVALLAIGAWRLLATPATPPIVGEADPDFQRVRAILDEAEVSEPASNLALLGDKHFLFSYTGRSFLMFGVRGRSWIALGGPVGSRAERLDLMWRFRELADAHAARPAFYAIGPDDLPEIVEIGFSIQKIGETATVPLADFSLEGSRRGNVRRSWRKAGEGGARFEVVAPGGCATLGSELRRVSDEWLARHAGGEKSFSLGRFDEAYVRQFPVALVRVGGRLMAFATLWTTAAKSCFSIDLMRYGEGAANNVMDFLFVELLRWGASEGYGAFDFGMAPLAGLEDRPLAPLMSRVGNLLFERGEEIYNFQGVRRYKDKYDPLWQPRYVAAPNKWLIPLLMADVGLLTSGGVGGLGRRPRKATAAPAPMERPLQGVPAAVPPPR
ncbi:MAG TPA: GNAT family N-acetyltransferase [Caulobacteraceae bacterium]|nr:GNAT family N-acetyltransferase [Caulobacteraceae bacterium]